MSEKIILSLFFLFLAFYSGYIIWKKFLKPEPKPERRLIVYNRLDQVRQDNNFTQEELAEKCGTTVNTIDAIERNVYCPTLYLALILSIVLHEDIHNIFYISVEYLCEK